MPASRRPLVLAAAAATAAALGATALALPAVAADSSPPAAERTAAAPSADAPSAAGIELAEGTLDWGFKDSFRAYVGAENIKVSQGARQAAENGPFTFTGGTGAYDTATSVNSVSFEGSVLFTAEHFTLELSDVKMISDRKSGTVQGDVTVDGEKRNDIPIAELDMAKADRGSGDGGATVFADIPATLTADGAAAFRYPAGQALDTATLSVRTADGGEPKPPPSAGPGPAASKSPDPSGKPQLKPESEPSAGASAKPSEQPASGKSGRSGTGAGDGAIADGNLDWGLKKRFREYVVGNIAHGKVELAGGAVKSGDGYRFPKGTGAFDADAKSLSASFDGSVRFLGHLTKGQYILDLKLSGLTVRANGTQGTLIADVSTKTRPKGKEKPKVLVYDDLEFASLTIPSGGLTAASDVVRLNAAPAKLTAEGAKAFDGMYKAGEELDPVTLAVSLDENTEVPDTTGGSTGTTGGDSTEGSTGSGTTGSTGSTGGDSTGGSGSTTAGSVGGSTGGSTGGSVGGSLASTGADIPATALIAASAGVAAAGAGVVLAVRRKRTATGS